MKNPYVLVSALIAGFVARLFCPRVGDLCRGDPADHRPCVPLHDAVYGERTGAREESVGAGVG